MGSDDNAVVTGIGTVIADDPLLTARGVRVKRVARRVVVDPRFTSEEDINIFMEDPVTFEYTYEDYD